MLLVVRELRRPTRRRDISANSSSASCVHRRRAVEQRARVEVDPVRLLRARSREFDDTLIVGTGKPSGVPRPVVKSSIVAPLAIIAVDDTPSLPGASSSASPRVAQRARRSAALDVTGARPPF